MFILIFVALGFRGSSGSERLMVARSLRTLAPTAPLLLAPDQRRCLVWTSVHPRFSFAVNHELDRDLKRVVQES